MGMFGGLRQRPVFGQVPGMDMMQAVKPPMEMNQPAMMQPEQKKPGFFSKGGGWVDALGAFGDAFGTNGPVYAQQKQQQNRLLQEQKMAEQQRMQAREDKQWEWQNKPKDTNDQLTRYMTLGGIDPNSDQGRAMYAAAATNEAYPERAVPYTDEQGNSGLRFIRSGMPPQQSGIQEGATATNPKTGEKLVFSNGAWKPMGGSAGDGTGGFPY